MWHMNATLHEVGGWSQRKIFKHMKLHRTVHPPSLWNKERFMIATVRAWTGSLSDQYYRWVGPRQSGNETYTPRSCKQHVARYRSSFRDRLLGQERDGDLAMRADPSDGREACELRRSPRDIRESI